MEEINGGAYRLHRRQLWVYVYSVLNKADLFFSIDMHVYLNCTVQSQGRGVNSLHIKFQQASNHNEPFVAWLHIILLSYRSRKLYDFYTK